jgi:hypothetical protein
MVDAGVSTSDNRSEPQMMNRKELSFCVLCPQGVHNISKQCL